MLQGHTQVELLVWFLSFYNKKSDRLNAKSRTSNDFQLLTILSLLALNVESQNRN